MNSRAMRKLATNPNLMARFAATGRLPQEVRVTSPLIELLEGIHARDRDRMRGVRLGRKLGYLSSVQFTTAQALLKWLKPFETALANENWPAEVCRDKRFRGPVRLGDLLACCDVYPQELEARAAAERSRS